MNCRSPVLVGDRGSIREGENGQALLLKTRETEAGVWKRNVWDLAGAPVVLPVGGARASSEKKEPGCQRPGSRR